MTIQQWIVPKNILEETHHAFRRGEHEVFVIWTASLNDAGPICRVSRCVVPQQSPGFSPNGGAFVHIPGAELSNIQFSNYDHRERSVIQLHTHPGLDVRMSMLDREWEVVNHIGALSIIVPVYGKNGLIELPGVNVYEREQGDWRLWTSAEVSRRLVTA